MDSRVASTVIEFGAFRLDQQRAQLLRQDGSGSFTAVTLGSRALELLRVLVDRAGEVVPKSEIMDVVWPGTVVDESNLTVQVAAVRKILDAGREEGSCIQTVPGRGYRFVDPITVPVNPTGSAPERPAPQLREAVPPRRSRNIWLWTTPTVFVFLAVLLVAGAHIWLRSAPTAAPRLSVAVLPFGDLSDEKTAGGFAEGITADLTSDLGRDLQTTVAAVTSAEAYKGRAANPRQVGRALNVRYVAEGSVRRVGTILRVNAQLTSAETGTQLWSERFDETVEEARVTQERIVARVRTGLILALVQHESARSQRERPNDGDAFDLVLQARAMLPSPPGMERALSLYERAISVDPSYVPALVGGAYLLIQTRGHAWRNFRDMRRAQVWLEKAREIAPQAAQPAYVYMVWLKTVGRCLEVIELGRHLIQADPEGARWSAGIYSQLGQCLAKTGHAEEDISLQLETMEADPSPQWTYSRYANIGYDQLLLGQDRDAVISLQRALALDPKMSASEGIYFPLAAAYARTGDIDAARQALAQADRLSPFMTVRSVGPYESPDPEYREQVTRYQDALRLAGERDHANEDADFGVLSDRALHDYVGRTPTDAPGAVTIRTADLPRLLANAKPLVIDSMWFGWEPSIPGAIGLKFVGLGGDFSDEAEERLHAKMLELTGGDLDRPIVAVGWNAERFDGRNLALRLVALGYKHVYWYRGGREAWAAAGLPAAKPAEEDW